MEPRNRPRTARHRTYEGSNGHDPRCIVMRVVLAEGEDDEGHAPVLWEGDVTHVPDLGDDVVLMELPEPAVYEVVARGWMLPAGEYGLTVAVEFQYLLDDVLGDDDHDGGLPVTR